MWQHLKYSHCQKKVLKQLSKDARQQNLNVTVFLFSLKC